MDDKKKKVLIEKISVMKNFEPSYSKENRAWFVEKLIRELEEEKIADSDLEKRALEDLQKATAVVMANRDFELAIKAAGNTRYTKQALKDFHKHRVEILYGAIAFNRQFVESQNLKYLLFIAKRRFRAICRMYFWVNPNYLGYFDYPDKCQKDNHASVNDNARHFWEELTPPWYKNFSPWKLNPAGIADPVEAIDSLFTLKTESCKCNRFDCEATMSIVLMDSLREAKSEDKFIKKIASNGSEYLSIHRPTLDVGVPLNDIGRQVASFMADTTDQGLMQYSDNNDGKRVPFVSISAGDLQVGDACYIFNHQLYKVFRPTGNWTGEHAVVYATNNRTFNSERGFVFGGHGKTGTLYMFYDEFLSELKSDLATVFQIMRMHLSFMRDGARAIDPGTVAEEEHNIQVLGPPAFAFRLLEYDKNALDKDYTRAKDYTKIADRKKKRPMKGIPAIVVVQSKTDHLFLIEHIDHPIRKMPLITNLKKRITDIVPHGSTFGKVELPILIERLEAPPQGATKNEIYDFGQWGVVYGYDKSNNKNIHWPFFVKNEGGELQRNEPNHDNLFGSWFVPGKTILKVRRPKVDFGKDHQDMLISNEAF